MDVLLTPRNELYKLNSNAPVLKKFIKILTEAKEHEKNGDKVKAIHSYLKVESQLKKILGAKRTFDVQLLQQLLIDVQEAQRTIDPLGLIEESILKKHQSKLTSKIVKVLTDTSSAIRDQQQKVIFLNKDGLDILAVQQASSTSSSSSSTKRKDKFKDLNVFYPLNDVLPIRLIFNGTQKLRRRKNPCKVPSSDSFLQTDTIKTDIPKKSIIDEIDLETSMSMRSSGFLSPNSKMPTTEKINTSFLDISNIDPLLVEETYRMALKCIFVPLNHIMSTRTMLSLLENSFNYSKKKHTEIEDSILDKCSYEGCFALLTAQIKSLENNSYFAMEPFKEPSAYEKFILEEKIRIKNLLNHVEIKMKVKPHKCLAKDIVLKNFNENYVILLRSLVKYEITKRANSEEKDNYEYFGNLLPFDNTKNRNVNVNVNVNGNVNESSMNFLSPFAIWLLEEFGERYGIRKFYRKLLMFDTIVHLFESKENSMRFTLELGNQILSVFKSDEPISRNEEVLFETTIKRLHRTVKGYFIDFSRIFKTFDSPKHLKILIDLLSYLCDVDYHLSLEKAHRPEDLIRKYQQLSVKKRYKSMLERNKAEYEKQTVLQLQNLIDEITLEIGGTLMYEKVFKKYCDITLITADTFFWLLEQEISRFFSESAKQYNPKEILTLCTKLSLLNKRFPSREKPFEVSKLFSPYLKSWISELSSTFSEWVKTGVENDKFTPLDKDTLISSSVIDLFCMFTEPALFISQLSESLTPDDSSENFMTSYGNVVSEVICLYANNIVDSMLLEFPENSRNILLDIVYKKEEQEKERLERERDLKRQNETETEVVDKDPTKTNDKKLQKKLSLKMTKMKTNLKSAFKISGSSENSSSNNLDKKKNKNKTDSRVSKINSGDSPLNTEIISIAEKSCIRMNNLEFARTKLSEIIADIGSDYFEKSFDNTFAYLKQKLNIMIAINIAWMDLKLQKELDLFLSDVKKGSSDKILNFLDYELEILYDNLLAPLFRRFLKSLWDLLILDMTMLISKKKINISHLNTANTKMSKSHKKEKEMKQHIGGLLNELKIFFYANGKGLSDSQIMDTLKFKGLEEYVK